MLSPSPLFLPPARGEIAAAFDRPEVRELIAHIDARLGLPGVEVLHKGRNTVTAVGIDAGGGRKLEIVIKDFRLRGLTRLKTLLAASKARRAWRGAHALIEAGLPTAVPIAYFETRRWGVVQRAFFLAERLAEESEIRLLFRQAAADALRPVLADLARTVRRGHDRGIVHRDLSDGNVFVAGGPDAGVRFYFLDTNRVRRRRRVGRFTRAKNLIRLGIPPDLRRGFLEAYAGQAGLRPSFVFFYAKSKSVFEGWLRFKKKARLRRWARRLKIQ